MTEEEASVGVSSDGQIRSDVLRRFPWRMLFPLPLPPISSDPRHPAQMATVDIKCPQRQ